VVVEEVAVAPALIATVLTQEAEMTQEQIIQQCIQEWVVTENARHQSLPCSHSKDISKIMKELEAIPQLIVGDMEEEQFEDMCMLTAFTEIEREAAMAKHHVNLKACTEMEQLQEKQDELA
jgi:hypothetical protein